MPHIIQGKCARCPKRHKAWHIKSNKIRNPFYIIHTKNVVGTYKVNFLWRYWSGSHPLLNFSRVLHRTDLLLLNHFNLVEFIKSPYKNHISWTCLLYIHIHSYRAACIPSPHLYYYCVPIYIRYSGRITTISILYPGLYVSQAHQPAIPHPEVVVVVIAA